MGRLDGKVALITGAGSGMGRLATHAFVREGARVVAADVNARGVEETVAESGGNAVAVAGDVTKEADVQRCVRTAVDRFGKLDVLYNNAGIFDEADESVLTTTDAIWDKTMAVNVKGLAFCCKHGIPELIKAGGGSVINVASFVALVGAATSQIAYTASKGAVLSMSRELAVQFARQGVRVNALCPGPVETPLLMRIFNEDPGAYQRRRVHLPMGRLAKPREIASAALFLAGEESSYVNGATFMVDGGLTAAYVTPE